MSCRTDCQSTEDLRAILQSREATEKKDEAAQHRIALTPAPSGHSSPMLPIAFASSPAPIAPPGPEPRGQAAQSLLQAVDAHNRGPRSVDGPTYTPRTESVHNFNIDKIRLATQPAATAAVGKKAVAPHPGRRTKVKFGKGSGVSAMYCKTDSQIGVIPSPRHLEAVKDYVECKDTATALYSTCEALQLCIFPSLDVTYTNGQVLGELRDKLVRSLEFRLGSAR